MSEWQPIETAPKDGSVVLATWGDLVVMATFHCEGSSSDVYAVAVPDKEFFQWHEMVNRLFRPTHWKPLPQPPKDST